MTTADPSISVHCGLLLGSLLRVPRAYVKYALVYLCAAIVLESGVCSTLLCPRLPRESEPRREESCLRTLAWGCPSQECLLLPHREQLRECEYCRQLWDSAKHHWAGLWVWVQ